MSRTCKLNIPCEFHHLTHFVTSCFIERMSTMDVVKLPDSVDHAIENISNPLTKAIGNTFGDLWFLALGGISHRADLRRAKYAHALNTFKEKTERKINEIPSKQRIEPNTQIIMGALTDAQFCIEDDGLRTMFENLIASSMAADKADSVHPAFSGIIRNMSSIDAKNIILFTKIGALPIANYRLICRDSPIKGGSGVDYFTNVFLSNPEIKNIRQQSRSMSSLEALGLVYTDYSNTLSLESIYEPFYKTNEYLVIKSYLEDPSAKKLHKVTAIDRGHLVPRTREAMQILDNVRINDTSSEQLASLLGQDDNDYFSRFSEVVVQKGVVCLTDFGIAFLCSCC